MQKKIGQQKIHPPVGGTENVFNLGIPPGQGEDYRKFPPPTGGIYPLLTNSNRGKYPGNTWYLGGYLWSIFRFDRPTLPSIEIPYTLFYKNNIHKNMMLRIC